MRSAHAMALAPLLLAVLAGPGQGARTAKVNRDTLLTVVSPASRVPAPAHPHVNVRVLFGATSDGVPADPATFRARLGSMDVTDHFEQVVERGRVVGVRAALAPSLVKTGPRRNNRLRFVVSGVRFPGSKGTPRDKDRIRFRSVESENQPPLALVAVPNADVVLPGIEIGLEGTQSSDPEGDALTYLWDFGDGTTSTEANPTKIYGEEVSGEIVVALTVSDGQTTHTDTHVLPSVPDLPDGKVPGLLRISGAGPLEFGAVAPGTTATRTFTVENLDTIPESLIRMRIGTTSDAFAVDTGGLDVGPGEEKTVTLQFTPSGEGHADTEIRIVATAANRNGVVLLAHGYGGSGAGAGPTLASRPVFHGVFDAQRFDTTTYATFPDGRRALIDNAVGTCAVPPNDFGPGSGDLCLTDADCAIHGGICRTSSTCPSGDRAGLPCSVPTDCPRSFCPSFAVFAPIDLCGDGHGGLYLLSDDGTFTEPDPSRETERAMSLMRIDFDDTGAIRDSQILTRLNTDTGSLACDGFGAGAGGRVYVPEYFVVPDSGSCWRTDREALTSIRKSNGGTSVVLPRLDAATGLGSCDDIDEVADRGLEILPDGSAVYAAFELGGLWRVRPTPLQFSPDITEAFELHPDGSVIYAFSQSGVVSVYRIAPDQVADNPLPLSALAPCATRRLPSNGGFTGVMSYALGPAATNPRDGIVHLSFRGGRTDAVDDALGLRGTLAIHVPADTHTCEIAGLVNLDELDLLTF